jgi:hypothetical protein
MAGNGSKGLALLSAELYDIGLDYTPGQQPQITSVSFLSSSSTVAVSGSGFRGLSEASSGNSQDSPADYPVVGLINVETGQAVFLLATNWSTGFVVAPLPSGLPSGHFLARVFVNGIPSAAQMLTVPTIGPNLKENRPRLSIERGGFRLNSPGFPVRPAMCNAPRRPPGHGSL